MELKKSMMNKYVIYHVYTDTSSWTRVKAQGDIPSPRSAACMASVGSSLYLFGGSTQDEGWTNSLFVFNTGEK